MNELDAALERWRTAVSRAYEAGGLGGHRESLAWERADDLYNEAYETAAGGLRPSGEAARKWARAVREAAAARRIYNRADPVRDGESPEDLLAIGDYIEEMEGEIEELRDEVAAEAPGDAWTEDDMLMGTVA